MSIEQMRKLMEAAAPLYETFVTEPMEVDIEAEHGDNFRDEEPALPLTVVANVDIPAMYMNAGDELYLKPTNNHGQVYSEENGLTYEWDFISHLANDRNMLEIKHVGHDESEITFEEDTQVTEVMQRPQLSIPPTQKEFEQAYQQLSGMCDAYEVMIKMQKERIEELEATLAMYEGKD